MTTRPSDGVSDRDVVLRSGDDDLPEGSVVDGEHLARPVDDAFDVVVVGSGAAGAVAAYVLSRAGLSVGIVEEGPWLRTKDMRPDAHATFRRVMRDAGMQVLSGRAFMPVLQGRCVGGSTLVNSAIAWRIPEDVVATWRERFGLGRVVTMRALEPHFDALERDLHVASVAPDVLGENNRLFLEQAERNGYAAAPMRRYERGCRGSGLCLTGCVPGAKHGMRGRYVPGALSRGARLFPSARVAHVELRGDRAVGVVARSRTGHALTLRARHAVVVAASTVQTPNLLRRSGIRSRALGKHFQVHPALAVGGLFDRPIGMSFGATQGAESIHFRATDRFKLETISLPYDLAGARIPGVGSELAERLARLDHVAVWAAQVRAEAEGTVTPGFRGVDRVHYTMTERDVFAARKALSVLVRMLFDAGAREVWPSIHGIPSALRSPDDVRLVEASSLDPRNYTFIATHLFGAARMGPDPRASVVDEDFAVHGLEGLYVVDSSVFPTNLGVNPQHAIMAMSRLGATRLAERLRKLRAVA